MRFLIPVCLILFMAACGQQDEPKVPAPAQLLLEISDARRYVSTDQVADWLINKDPSLLLIDVRDHEAFDAFSLPGAINIPLAALLDESSQKLLDCGRHFAVFYSNGDIDAEKAWLLSQRTGCRHSYIMKGGLNTWMETILYPAEPPQTADATTIAQYHTRRAAAQYFIGRSKAMAPEPFVETRPAAPTQTAKTIEVAPKPRKKEVAEEEGC